MYRYALVGEPIADAPACEPTSGTVMHEYVSSQSIGWVWQLTRISKDVDDQFWTVITTSSVSADYPNEAEEFLENPDVQPSLHAQIDDTYLTRTLGATFYCDYPDLD